LQRVIILSSLSSPSIMNTLFTLSPPLFLLAISLGQCQALSAPSRRDFLDNSISSITTIATSSIVATTSSTVPAYANEELLAASKSSPLSLPPLGLGAWAWGDSIFWGYDPRNDEDLKEVFDYALSKNLAFFDTAELYGLGRSEALLGKFRKEGCATKEDEEKVIIASKFAALPWRTKRQDVVKACKASVKRLGGQPIDLYQIHFPNAWSNEDYWDGLGDAYDQGLVKAVGVSNYGVDALRACHAKLAKRGIKLASNQIQMSLLYRWPIDNGLLDACKELDVKVLSYSPLALGFLAGKYNKSNLPSGPRAKIGEQLYADDNEAYDNLLGVMKDIAGKHNAVPSQVAINWAIAKGTTPIPGARTINQVKQNLATLEWTMTAEEENLLDEASKKVTGFVTPDKTPFPRTDLNTGLTLYDS